MKNYVQSGKMGRVICAEAVRTDIMSKMNGWFANRELGGVILRDAAIHEIDQVLYIMGYPKATKVLLLKAISRMILYTKLKVWVPVITPQTLTHIQTTPRMLSKAS